MLLKPREPFSFTRTLRFILSPPALLNSRKFAPLLDYFEEDEYRRVAEIEGELVLYGVSAERQGSKTLLNVRVLAGPTAPVTVDAVRELVERQLATELDLNLFYRVAAADPVLAELARHFRGMRIPQSPSVYETVVCAILEQQVNLSFAHQVKKALIETYGQHVELQGRRYNAFPLPAALAIATPPQLRRIQISGPKARYIIGISRATLDGSLDLEGLRAREPAVAYAKLLEQKGVGSWTAHYVGLRALGHLDCLPAADVGLQKAIQRFYGLRKQPTSPRLEKLARAWAGWRSYATFYLWLTFWEDRAWNEWLAEELRVKRRKGKS
ncbi:MAG: DNA-3-methyladenine glycosylase 2 family protein [Acidobacteria bacterium]|nr:DNA-3-methyladenine glycosylase 2 family protein [Acidobacteriota bacterium]